MKPLLAIFAASYLAFSINSVAAPAFAQPIALHPENPHYFLFRGKPAALVTSAEHYGAVLNLDFDYARYLETLAADGLNLTRTFSGAYVEPAHAFNITENTLAPKEGRFVSPWARSDQPGYGGGGNKFDLAKWDPSYFERLSGFVAHAGKLGIVVEFTFFCPMYDESQWKLSPLNASNNVNGVGAVDRERVYRLDGEPALLAIQEALVRKIIAELRDADNVIYEICNEPYFGGVTLEWQHHIADIIVDAESDLPRKHLISQNIANGSQRIETPHPAVSVFNFHYASPPDAVGLNYDLNKAIGDNETGFKGTADEPYRTEAWEFLLAGGGLFNHLDYSFAAGHEGGDFEYPPTQPGGGNPGFRQQIRVLKDFLHSFDFTRMRPDSKTFRKLASDQPASAKLRATVFSEPGKQYAIYLVGGGPATIALALPRGDYELEWIDVASGRSLVKHNLRVVVDGETTLESPEFKVDAAAAIKAR